jgi:hypothetical protein
MKILIELELEVLTPELIATLRAVEKDQFVRWREKIEELNKLSRPPEQTMIPGLATEQTESPGVKSYPDGSKLRVEKPSASAPKPRSAPKEDEPEQTPEAAPDTPKKAGRPPKAKAAPELAPPAALTADDIRKALVAYKNEYGITAAREKLAIFAVSRVDQLNPSDYSALLAELV